jgi:hypothetical protein
MPSATRAMRGREAKKEGKSPIDRRQIPCGRENTEPRMMGVSDILPVVKLFELISIVVGAQIGQFRCENLTVRLPFGDMK